MRAERLINRTLCFLGMMLSLVLLCAEMETLSNLQFVLAKAGALVLGYSVWQITLELDRAGRI